jgi:DNA (cytosine-5)-methyltransferase 1
MRMPSFPAPIDVELFAGAGGLSLGLAAAGIGPAHVYEKNSRACLTLRHNKRSVGGGIPGDVHEADVREVVWGQLSRPVRLLAAGPPCQPFSLAGKHRADEDPRNEFPATLQAIRELEPAVVLIENVQGLTRRSFRPYFDYLLRQLAFPSVRPTSPEESWTSHDSRLQRHSRAGAEPEFEVRSGVLNAADFGVPQVRTRIVIIASRRGTPVVELPQATHSRGALILAQETPEYWQNRGLRKPTITLVPKRGTAQHEDPDGALAPRRTVRDALRGLREPSQEATDPLQHWIVPGARLYRGHKGSIMDWPSKTIKAGVHGVAGGENVLHLDDVSYRYFTLREMARMQGFPDSYFFHGPRSRIIGQIGNAVPCGLAEAIGAQIVRTLHAAPTRGGGVPCGFISRGRAQNQSE